MSKGEELAGALARWIHLARPSIVSLDFNDVAEISEAKQAIIEAIDGPEGYVMVEVPVPVIIRGDLFCCFTSRADNWRVICKHPSKTNAADMNCVGRNHLEWCPLKEA